MKDLIEISVNGKVVASHEMYLEGASPLQKIERVKRFRVALADTGVIIESEFALIDENDIVIAPVYEERKSPTPIEPMMKTPVVETPVQKQMEAVSNPVPPTTTYNELPVKTRKPRGPNKPKEPVVEESVFDKPKEEVVAPVVEAPAFNPPVEVKKVIAPPIFAPPTTARVNELAKLIKMWCKASALKIDTVTIELLKAQAFDIVENDSDVTIEAGIKEAARLMQG